MSSAQAPEASDSQMSEVWQAADLSETHTSLTEQPPDLSLVQASPVQPPDESAPQESPEQTPDESSVQESPEHSSELSDAHQSSVQVVPLFEASVWVHSSRVQSPDSSTAHTSRWWQVWPASAVRHASRAVQVSSPQSPAAAASGSSRSATVTRRSGAADALARATTAPAPPLANHTNRRLRCTG